MGVCPRQVRAGSLARLHQRLLLMCPHQNMSEKLVGDLINALMSELISKNIADHYR